MHHAKPLRTLLVSCLVLASIIGAMTAGRTAMLPVVSDGSTITLPAGSVIAAEGDSITYGQDTSATGGQPPINDGVLGRSISPFPETLAAQLGRCAVVNRGYPGDRSVEGLVRWQNEAATELTS